MTKSEYLKALDEKLRAAKVDNPEEIIEYYSDIIDDKAEELGGEENALASMEDIDTVVKNTVIGKKTIKSLLCEKIERSRSKAREDGKGGIWLFICVISSPFWVPLLFAFLMAAVAVYLAFWAVIASFFACEAAFGFAGIMGIFGAVKGIFDVGITTPSVIAYFGAGLILIGFSVILWRPVFLLGRLLTGFLKKIITAVKKKIANI